MAAYTVVIEHKPKRSMEEISAMKYKEFEMSNTASIGGVDLLVHFIPNGYSYKSKGHPNLILQVHWKQSLTPISQLEITFTSTCAKLDKRSEYTNVFVHKGNGWSGFPCKSISRDQLLRCTDLRFKVVATIEKLFDIKGNEIDKNKWNQYLNANETAKVILNNIDDQKYTDNTVMELTSFKQEVVNWMNKIGKEISTLKNQIGHNGKHTKFKNDELKNWLNDIGMSDLYYDNFKNEGYDDLSIVSEMDNDDLKDIGIEKKGHRKKILININLLKIKYSNNQNEGDTMYVQ